MSNPNDPSTNERRIAPRLRPALETTCAFDPIANKAIPRSGLVWNISLTGVSMLVEIPVTPGEILTGEFTSTGRRDGLPVILRVVHVNPVPTGDFILGAQFLRELTPAELLAFIEP